VTPGELREIGEKLFGPKWQSKLARAMPVNTRTVRRWLSGERKIHPAIAERVRSLRGPDKAKLSLIANASTSC
jgi:plasmid maintenance system antidote protein VapI